MQPKRKPVRKTTTPRKATPVKRAVVKKPVTTQRIVQKPVEDKSFNAIIAKVRKDLAGTHVFVMSMPWEAKGIATVLGAKWHSDLRQFLYEGGVLPAGLVPYASEDFTLERWIEDELNRQPRPITGILASMKPRPHQVKAIKKIEASAKAGWRGFILADNVGIGKTIEAVFGAYTVAQAKGFTPQRKAATLIIAPKSVLPHWRNTIKATGVNNMRFVVINYDQAKKLLDVPPTAESAKTTRTKNKRIANLGVPTIKWDIIIADESHKLKNVSQRTAAFNKVARYSNSPQAAPFVIWTSATVGQNPLEIGYLAPLISQLSGGAAITSKDWGDWLISNHFHVTKSVGGSYSWITPKKEHSEAQKKELQKVQQKDVGRLSEILFGPSSPSIRRNPEDIAGWPTQTHIPTPMELEPDEKRLYDEAWRSFRSFMQMNPRGKNPSGGLAATMRFRQKASLISALHTASFANDLLDNGQQIGISVEFIESLDLIKDYLEKKGWHCAEFSGRNTNEREDERIRFQKGEAKVMIFTVQEGISLHAGELLADGTHATNTKRALLIHDIRYSSIAMAQILGRMTRDGELANAFYMYTENTIESQILQVMLRKMMNLRALSGDNDDTIEVIQDLLDGVSK